MFLARPPPASCPARSSLAQMLALTKYHPALTLPSGSRRPRYRGYPARDRDRDVQDQDPRVVEEHDPVAEQAPALLRVACHHARGRPIRCRSTRTPRPMPAGMFVSHATTIARDPSRVFTAGPRIPLPASRYAPGWVILIQQTSAAYVRPCPPTACRRVPSSSCAPTLTSETPRERLQKYTRSRDQPSPRSQRHARAAGHGPHQSHQPLTGAAVSSWRSDEPRRCDVVVVRCTTM